MTSLNENYYAVLLHGSRVGTLCQKGDHTRFVFHESYLTDAGRPVLGLRFEENLTGVYAAALRLPRWFSNLLPEGPLREWIAYDRGVSLDREMELLAQVGHDLPGAVQVLAAEGPDDEEWVWPEGEDISHGPHSSSASPWKFSLAGVALKFSMLEQGDRLTVPVGGVHGDWLVKFPDYRHPDVPLNEYSMMLLAAAAGIETPDVRLVHRDDLEGVPGRMWPNKEVWAYAVRRFDRLREGRDSVHIEDFAQVRDKYPQDKYEGSYETVAALAYRGHDLLALEEVVRRIIFCVVIGNGDAHLKNWSLIYNDRRVPTLSPVYDLVSTAVYSPPDEPEELGLKLGGGKRFSDVRFSTFEHLQNYLERRLGAIDSNLRAVAEETVLRIRECWPEQEAGAAGSSFLRPRISEFIMAQTRALLGS
jgi:serine/threonine-protein kinase HipA